MKRILSTVAVVALVAGAFGIADAHAADGTRFVFRGPMSRAHLIAAATPTGPSGSDEATGDDDNGSDTGDVSAGDGEGDGYVALPADYPASSGDTVVWTLSNGWAFSCPAEADRKAGKLLSDWPFDTHPLNWTRHGSQIVSATFEGVPNTDQIDLYFTEAGALDLVNVGAGLPWGCAPGGPDTANMPGFDLAAFEPFTATVTGVEIRHPM